MRNFGARLCTEHQSQRVDWVKRLENLECLVCANVLRLVCTPAALRRKSILWARLALDVPHKIRSGWRAHRLTHLRIMLPNMFNDTPAELRGMQTIMIRTW